MMKSFFSRQGEGAALKKEPTLTRLFTFNQNRIKNLLNSFEVLPFQSFCSIGEIWFVGHQSEESLCYSEHPFRFTFTERLGSSGGSSTLLVVRTESARMLKSIIHLEDLYGGIKQQLTLWMHGDCRRSNLPIVLLCCSW